MSIDGECNSMSIFSAGSEIISVIFLFPKGQNDLDHFTDPHGTMVLRLRPLWRTGHCDTKLEEGNNLLM